MDNHIVEHAGSGGSDNLQGAPDWLRQRAAQAEQHPGQYPSGGSPESAAPAARTQPAAGIPWPPGFAGELAQLIYASSIRPVKEIAITAALGTLAGICGHNWITPTGAGLNLYVALLARSGVGKEAISEGINMVRNAARDKGSLSASDFFMFDQVASGPALVKNLENKTSVVHVEGELGHKVRFMATEKTGPFASLRTQWTLLYHKSGIRSVTAGTLYSNKDNDARMSGDRIAYSIIGDTTPGTFYEALNGRMMEDGFLSRFLIIECTSERPPENKNCVLPTDQFGVWASGLIFCAAQARAPLKVQFFDDAWAIREYFEQQCDAEVNRTNDEAIRQIWTRAGLKVLRIACLLAVADNPMNPWATKEHVEWALDLVRRDLDLFLRRLDTGDIGTDDDARERKLVRIFRDFLTEPLKPSYKIPEEMRQNSIIPRSYIQIRIAKSPAFYNYLGKEGNTVLAINHTIQSCIDQGYLMEVDKAKVAEAYSYHGKSYRIIKLPDYAALARER